MRRVVVCLVLTALTGALSAQSSGGTYSLRKQAIAAPGARASGGNFLATTTVGQPTAATQSGGAFRLIGGFHAPRSATLGVPIFCDSFESRACP